MNHDDQLVIGWLGDHDAPCPVCGYNLRGVSSAVCPECASPIELTVGSAHAGVGPWVLGLIALSLGLGFDGVMTVLLMVPLIATGGEAVEALIMFGGMASLALVSGLGMAVLIARRRTFRARPRDRQWFWARLIFLTVLLVHLIGGGGLVLLLVLG